MTKSPSEERFNRVVFEKIAFAVSEAIDQAHWCENQSVHEKAALFDVLAAQDIQWLGIYAFGDTELETEKIKNGQIVWRRPGAHLVFDTKTKIWKCGSARGRGVVAGFAVLGEDSVCNIVERLLALLAQSVLTIHRDFRPEAEKGASS